MQGRTAPENLIFLFASNPANFEFTNDNLVKLKFIGKWLAECQFGQIKFVEVIFNNFAGFSSSGIFKYAGTDLLSSKDSRQEKIACDRDFEKYGENPSL
ncbi:hypothetical protein [Methanocorpusculum vombati]|uniref:Uncharacterized protein n=1 Tax=Methanocorpusculum vombati TaxID=3002864 RepID=A0ABT4IKA6_9EURY|nr:hypothetical protein [Methanocorpusculum vombati]MCZ9318844.1 hypothetical protein [Methanocorpusculum sp.]MCZ0862176.1 hypothetical protein [Methanocorpusculum vombati]MDE2533495.1 hypothetical protein [Methanocorpusculum sp.]MDE2545324.1 hypothetical protein [Methanocorpusculum sp.]HJK77986.1 hypothetical protein [Methanocorpusculum sp.]